MIKENIYNNFDIFYEELVEYILKNGTKINDNVRTVYVDGTPAYYTQVVGLQFKFEPLKDKYGNYVALLPTTRQAPYKSAIKELEWIWIRQSNDVNVLEKELGCKYWNEWSINEIDRRNIKYIQPKLKRKKDIKFKYIKIKEIIDKNKPFEISDIYGKYFILDEYINEKGNYIQKIQFERTGLILEKYKYGNCPKDYYQPTVQNIGYYGNCRDKRFIDYFGKNLLLWIRKWENMIRRCYNENRDNYKHYNDIFVSEKFKCCEYFLDWVIENNKFDKKYLSILQVDKDYYSSNCYSEDTCVIIPEKFNKYINSKKWYFYKDNLYFSEQDFSEFLYNEENLKNILHSSGRYNKFYFDKYIKLLLEFKSLKIFNPKEKCKHGYRRFNLDIKKHIGKSYGYQLSKKTYKYNSQVDYIINEIKNNPNSRRIITELYDVDDLEYMALVPCVRTTQWTVENNKLILSVRQRSCDVALGLVSNIWQYQVLQHLIAKECNLEVGELIWTVDNIHIYDRHIDKIREQIKREKFNRPKFKINNFTGFYNFKWTDVEIINYEYGNKISYEVAI